jgi:hypothetical protein
MRAQRVKTGFRRLAIALAAPFVLSALVASAVAIYGLMTMPPAATVVYGPDEKRFEYPVETNLTQIAAQLSKEYGRPITVGYGKEILPFSSQMWARNEVQKAWIWATASAILGALVYVVIWTVGWIIGGFAGDGEEERHQPAR